MVRQNPIIYSKIERCDVPIGLIVDNSKFQWKKKIILGPSLKISHYKLNSNEE